MRATSLPVLLVLLLSCAAPPPPPPEPEPEPAPVVEPFPDRFVWTAAPETSLRLEGRRTTVPHLFTRLEVMEPLPDGMLRVRCPTCEEGLEGVVSREDVVHGNAVPVLAAEEGLAEFLLAIRQAADRRDMTALRPVLSPWFTHSVEAPHGAGPAIIQWRREGYRSIDRLPTFLDRGVATRDGSLWMSPPEFLNDPRYSGPRAGFERDEEGRWVWLFLVGLP